MKRKARACIASPRWRLYNNPLLDELALVPVVIHGVELAMSYTLHLGVMKSALPRRAAGGADVFRLAVLGDFSGRALSGKLETGDELARRKPISVDVDNLDDVVKRMKIKLALPIGADGGAVEIPIQSMDDFHPDQLYDNVEIFSVMSGLRQRLKTNSTFAKAAQEVQSWLGEKAALALPPAAGTRARKPVPLGSVIPADAKLSDFARLIGRPAAPPIETPIDQLVKEIVAPYVVPAKDPKQDKLLAAVDQAIGESMRAILHHPDFQALESTWRSLEFLVRRLETSTTLKIVLYDISAEEFAADLSSTDDLQETGLYKLLVEQPPLDAQQGPLSVFVSTYFFEQTPPHAELLGRMARIAAAAQAPFLAAIGADVIKKVKEEEIHPLIRESWSALRALPEAVYLGLAVPRFMLRNPYGERTDPIDRFDFEEFTPQIGTRGMLWASGAVLAGLLLGETCMKQGLRKMNLGSIMSAGDMPFYYYEDADGDKVALPCTERLLSVDMAAHVARQGFMPVLAIKGRPEVRLGSFQSLGGKPLAGPWAPVVITPAGAAPAAPPEPARDEVPPAAVVSVAPADSGLKPLGGGQESAVESQQPAEPPSPVGPAEAAEAAASSADAELDALLASLAGSEPTSTATDTGELDPGLAALLADL